MKKILALAALSLVLASPAHAQRAKCASTGSTNAKLCTGLLDIYKFEEASDYERADSYGYLDWHEADGVNIAASASGKFGFAASFAGTTSSYLYLPDTVVFGAGYWTVAGWVKPTSFTTGAVIFGNDELNNHGPSLTWIATGALVFQVYQDDNSAVTVTSSTMTSGAWHLFVVRVRPNDTGTGVTKIGISIDGAAFTEATTTRWLRNPYPVQTVTLGWNYNGLIDNLLFASRPWDDVDVSLYYNSGTGINFPF